ncbi:MAG: SDR family oxidoreductase [Siphonobacter sp.]
MNTFNDKVVWITGASSGIGEALAHAFAKQKACLVLSSRREDELLRVEKSLGLPAGHVMLVRMDMTATETFPEKVESVIKRFGRIDILIQNAGISQRGLANESSLTIDRRIMEVNYFGVVGLTKVVLPYLLAQKNGIIVPISSIAGYVATPMRSSYAASKFAIRGFFDSLRAEIWREGLWVTIICPGYIKTAISLNALNAEGKPSQRMDDNQAKGINPEVCAQKILEAIRNRKREVYIAATREKMGMYLERFAPGLLWRIIRNYSIKSK